MYFTQKTTNFNEIYLQSPQYGLSIYCITFITNILGTSFTMQQGFINHLTPTKAPSGHLVIDDSVLKNQPIL